MAPTQELLSLAQAAEELGITPDALRGAIARKVLAPVRIDGRTNMLTREEVERYRRERLGRRGKRMVPEEALTEQQRKQRAYQHTYYQRRKAASSEHLGKQGKRPQPEGLTEQQRKQRAYQAAYYQRRKAARQQQPATEPAQ
jgi:Helix-turn-helix domain